MKTLTVLLAVMLFALPAQASTYKLEFVRCYDGDTCTFNIGGLPDLFGKKIPVRVRGVDAPEMRGKCEGEKAMVRKAKALVNRTLRQASSIALVNPERGKYFRIVANIEADGVDIGTILIKAKLARWYNGGKRQPWCRR